MLFMLLIKICLFKIHLATHDLLCNVCSRGPAGVDIFLLVVVMCSAKSFLSHSSTAFASLWLSFPSNGCHTGGGWSYHHHPLCLLLCRCRKKLTSMRTNQKNRELLLLSLPKTLLMTLFFCAFNQQYMQGI